MQVLFARASTHYTGRLEAALALSDVLIILRDPALGGDGSALVIDPTSGIGARNWMPAGSVTYERPGGFQIVHESRGEMLEVFIEKVHWSKPAVPTIEPGKLTKVGQEREVSDALAERVDWLSTQIGEGPLELLGREYRTASGPIDLVLAGRRHVFAVEIKRLRATVADCYQLLRYCHALSASDEFRPRKIHGLLVGPVLAKNAKEMIDTHSDLRFLRVSFADLADIPLDV